MKKKTYMRPQIQVTTLKMSALICGSIYGVEGTGSFSTTYDSEESDIYL